LPREVGFGLGVPRGLAYMTKASNQAGSDIPSSVLSWLPLASPRPCSRGCWPGCSAWSLLAGRKP